MMAELSFLVSFNIFLFRKTDTQYLEVFFFIFLYIAMTNPSEAVERLAAVGQGLDYD